MDDKSRIIVITGAAGGVGRPDDIADAGLFLASGDASCNNGPILYVDGGRTSFGSAGSASNPEEFMETAQ